MKSRWADLVLLVAFLLVAFFALFEWNAHAATLPDYTIAAYSGEPTVTQGQTFTRTITVSNVGTGSDKYGVNATVNNVSHAYFVSVTGTANFLGGCRPYYFTSGALNYVRCFRAVLAPGESATMTVMYRAPLVGWLGWVFTGGGTMQLVAPSMQIESDKTNNSWAGPAVTTTVVAP